MDNLRAKGKEATAKEQSQAETLHVIYESMQRGIEYLPVDLYKSHSYKFVLEDGKIRLPFSAVKGPWRGGGTVAHGGQGGRPLYFLRRFAEPFRHHQGGGGIAPPARGAGRPARDQSNESV